MPSWDFRRSAPAKAVQFSQIFGSLAEFRELCAEKFDADSNSAELAWQRAEEILEKCERLDITPIVYGDETAYPDRLNAIKDPPPVLYVKGNSEPMHERALVAIVGTREPTHHGQKAAMALGVRAAQDRIPVVSGLALGCDTLGHQGCVEANGTAIAVMAHGLDHLYPKANRDWHMIFWKPEERWSANTRRASNPPAGFLPAGIGCKAHCPT